MSTEITSESIKVGNRYFVPYDTIFNPFQVNRPPVQTIQLLKVQIYQDLGEDVILTIKHFEFGGSQLLDKVYMRVSKANIVKQGIVVVKPVKQVQ